MVKILRKIIFICFLTVVAFSQNASAVLTEYLPESSYGDGQWQGFKYYDEGQQNGGGFLRGRIDFAVYDQQNLELDDEIALVEELDLQGRFIYAYHILNDRGNSDAAVAYFSIGSVGPVSPDIDYTGSVDNGYINGIEPSGSPSPGVWNFDNGLILKGHRSWFLILGSNGAPVAGTYEVRSEQESELPVPEEVPEPGILTLLGIGGAMVLSRRKKNIKQ
jgi:hypothetical protein